LLLAQLSDPSCGYQNEGLFIAWGALTNEARFDAPNDPGFNGERLVQTAVLRYWQRAVS